MYVSQVRGSFLLQTLSFGVVLKMKMQQGDIQVPMNGHELHYRYEDLDKEDCFLGCLEFYGWSFFARLNKFKYYEC